MNQQLREQISEYVLQIDEMKHEVPVLYFMLDDILVSSVLFTFVDSMPKTCNFVFFEACLLTIVSKYVI